MRPCLDCGDLALVGSRCPSCKAQRERLRNAQPKRKGYRRAEYLAQPKDGICWLCGFPIEPGQGTRDHITPLSKDFYAVRTMPAHRSCNSSRGAKSI